MGDTFRLRAALQCYEQARRRGIAARTFGISRPRSLRMISLDLERRWTQDVFQ